MRVRALSLVAAGTFAVVSVSVATGVLLKKEFSFNDPKGVNSVQWFIDSPLEPIAGVAEKIDGTLVLDPEQPASATGTLTIPTASLRAPVEAMTGHMKSDGWMAAEKYPTIKFELKKVENVKKTGEGTYTADATGDLTIKDVTKSVTAKAEGIYRPDGLKIRLHGAAGDTYKIRADFKIKRSDYGIGPADTSLVGDVIELRVAVTGGAPAK